MHPETETTENAGLPEPAAPVTAAAPDRAALEAALEALLFATEEPLTPVRLAQVLGARKGEILEAIDRLNVFYAETRRAFRVAPLAGGFQLVTTPEHAELLSRLHKDRSATRLSRAALETLAIIAFKQPVTRAEIDTIRGVSASDGVLRHLMERSLARIAGRSEAPGRPLLYGTTREFLAHFGLHAIADLPRTDELAALLADVPQPVTPTDDVVAEEPRPAASVWTEPPAEDESEELSFEPESHSVEESDEHGGAAPSQ